MPEAIGIFEEMLFLEELAENTRQRALLALGYLQLILEGESILDRDKHVFSLH